MSSMRRAIKASLKDLKEFQKESQKQAQRKDEKLERQKRIALQSAAPHRRIVESLLAPTDESNDPVSAASAKRKRNAHDGMSPGPSRKKAKPAPKRCRFEASPWPAASSVIKSRGVSKQALSVNFANTASTSTEEEVEDQQQVPKNLGASTSGSKDIVRSEDLLEDGATAGLSSPVSPTSRTEVDDDSSSSLTDLEDLDGPDTSAHLVKDLAKTPPSHSSQGLASAETLQTPSKPAALHPPTPASLPDVKPSDGQSPSWQRRSGRACKATSKFLGIIDLPPESDLGDQGSSLPTETSKTAVKSEKERSAPTVPSKTKAPKGTPRLRTPPPTKTVKPTAASNAKTQHSKVIKTFEPTSTSRAKTQSSKVIKTSKSIKPTKRPAPVKQPSNATALRRNSCVKLAVDPEKLQGAALSPKRAATQDPTTAGLPSPPLSQTGAAKALTLPDIDPDLLALSEHMTRRASIEDKRKARGEPTVWADSRQALCETVPYFKKPQGGCHQNDRHVYAFLFDGVGHCREYMDSDVIIARAGGGMECDAQGQMVQKKHQSMQDSQVQAVKNDIALQNPFIVICGDKNTGALTKMPHKYCVLGWFKPVDVWSEKTAGKGGKAWITVKYRLERLSANEAPWYAPEDLQIPPQQQKAGPVMHETCDVCEQHFPRVYLCGWMCLNADCTQFWRLGNRDAPCGTLAYDPAFLLHRHPWDDETEPYSVVPKLPDVGKVLGDHVRYINTRGVCCPECGRCNSRYLFSHWRCDNRKCNWTLRPQHDPIEPAALHSPWDNYGDGPALARNKHDGSVNVKVEYIHGYKVYTYTFDGIEGSFTHAIANSRINRETRGPNHMLSELQTTDMGLERRRFGGEKMSRGKAEAMAQSTSVDEPEELATSAKRDDSATSLQPEGSEASAPEEVKASMILETHTTSAILEVPTASAVPEEPAGSALLVPKTVSSEASRITDATKPAQPTVLKDPETSAGLVKQDEVVVLTERDQSAAMGGMGEDATSAALVESRASLPTPAIQDVLEEVDDPENVSPEAPKKAEAEDGDFMTAFSMNYGMPYKFVAGGATRPFEDAPEAVRACRSRLNWAARTFLSSKPAVQTDFNEELIFAYMEGQKIEYHDDGEEGLGPRIATLSLGGKAKMHMRMKAKHYIGCSKTGVLTAEEPRPGSIGGNEMFEKRHAAWIGLQKLKDTDRAAYRKRLTQIPKELGIHDKRNKKADDLVTITLSHGDIVLMDGYEIQKYLEHKVVPEEHLRFALTCREVLASHLSESERPSYEVRPDEYGYDGSKVQEW